MSAWGTSTFWVPVLLLLAAALTAWLAWVAWRRRRLPGATPMALTAGLVAAWCALAALETTSQNQAVRLFIVNFEYISQSFLPVAWLLFVLEFAGLEARLRRALPWLLIVPVVTAALVLTNRWHGLLPPDAATPANGPWYWVQTYYSYLLLAASFIVLTQAWFAIPADRHRLATLLACMAAPLTWTIIGSFLFVGALQTATAAPLVLALSALIAAWALLSVRLFDVTPLARAAVIAGLRQAVVVIDLDQRLVDFNPAAAELFGWAAPAGSGQPASQALAEWPELAAAVRGEPQPPEMVKGLGAARRVFELGLAPLADAHGRALGQVLTLRDATEHRRAQDELARLSSTDSLTGLADRRRLDEALADEVRRARRYEAPLALLLLDVDHFKALNDQLGRPAGDEALRAVARAMQRLARQSDLAGRLDDDEFMLLLPHTNLLGAETVAGRLAAAASQVQGAGGAALLSLSVGAVELAPDDDGQGASLLARAEKALRAAKEAGGGRVMVET